MHCRRSPTHPAERHESLASIHLGARREKIISIHPLFVLICRTQDMWFQPVAQDTTMQSTPTVSPALAPDRSVVPYTFHLSMVSPMDGRRLSAQRSCGGRLFGRVHAVLTDCGQSAAECPTMLAIDLTAHLAWASKVRQQGHDAVRPGAARLPPAHRQASAACW